MRKASVVSVAVLLMLLSGCSLSRNTDLYIPFVYQERSGYCLPASIQMWYRSDHNSTSGPSQYSIASYMGFPNGWGGLDPVPGALRHFTYTYDAVIDRIAASQEDDKAAFFSRQISVIDYGEPVLAIVDNGFHAGILTGGRWSTRSDGYYQWNSTTFHDPSPQGGGPNIFFAAIDWIYYNCGNGDSTCEQIYSEAASMDWQANLLSVGNRVKVRGLRDWPPSDWPPEI